MEVHDGEAEVGFRGVGFENPPVQIYNEETFWYFLGVERTRSERSGRPFALVLVDVVEEQPGVSAYIKAAVVPTLFSSLRCCIRGTDFIGWYRENHVVGAGLVEGGARPETVVARAVAQRITEVLRECLQVDMARRLRVRVVQPPAPVRIESDDPQVAQLIPREI